MQYQLQKSISITINKLKNEKSIFRNNVTNSNTFYTSTNE